MSRERDAYLREMGLWPLWRLRQGAGRADAGSDAAAAPQGARPAETASPEAGRAPDTAGGGAGEIAELDWAALERRVRDCTACLLHQSRTQPVFGVGDQAAQWLFVGEAPGAEEDARGEPFVGQAGKLLDNMLAAVGLKRGDGVYIANVLKCRPPGNRNPQPEEVRRCEPYLLRQIELIRPRLIFTLGKFAAQTLLGREATIASLRGRVHDYHGIPLVASYHPAYLLRNLPDKAKAWEDLCLARQVILERQGAETP